MLRPGSFVGRSGVAGLGAVLLVCACFAATAIAAGSPAASAGAASTPNLIKNGTFRFPSPFREACGLGPTAIAVWVIGPAGICDFYNTSLTPPAGATQSILLDSEGAGSVTQTVATTPGETYVLQWYGAGRPGGPPTIKTMHVSWDGGVVASPTYNETGHTTAAMGWRLSKVVVTANSASSSVEFADADSPPTAYGPMITEVSLAGDATLYLPASAALSPTGKLVAAVRNATGAPLTNSGLTVKLYASLKTLSYAPATRQLIASGADVNGQAVLQLKLPSSLKGKTITATATLAGANYLPVTHTLTIKVT